MKAARLIGLVAALAIGATTAASADLVKRGNLLVSFDGGIAPTKLPRHSPAPVSMAVDSTIRTTDGADPPPQLRTIAIAINRKGRLFDRGLPTCRVRRIQPSTMAAARKVCGDALVGSGRVDVRIHFANQRPFTLTAPMLVFNAEPVRGKRRILAQIYGRRPPSAIVLPFRIAKRRGTFGTVVWTSLPKAAQRWAYMTHFEMKLQRTYRYRGRQWSYVSASCAAPAGFPGAVFPFAKARFGFADGRTVTSTLIRSCTVR